MKLQQARELGKAAGLETDDEFVNNVILHQSNLFVGHSETVRELIELFQDAEYHGVRFSNICGDAIPEGDDEKEPCLFHRKLKAEGVTE